MTQHLPAAGRMSNSSGTLVKGLRSKAFVRQIQRPKAWSARLLQKEGRSQIELRPTQPSFEYQEEDEAGNRYGLLALIKGFVQRDGHGQPRLGVGEIRFVDARDPQEAYIFL
jgi:hypothetical protein